MKTLELMVQPEQHGISPYNRGRFVQGTYVLERPERDPSDYCDEDLVRYEHVYYEEEKDAMALYYNAMGNGSSSSLSIVKNNNTIIGYYEPDSDYYDYRSSFHWESKEMDETDAETYPGYIMRILWLPKKGLDTYIRFPNDDEEADDNYGCVTTP